MKGSKNVVALFLFTSIITLFLISFISCSEGVITEPIKQDDETLRREIVGSWSISSYRITYFEDGTYLASSSMLNDKDEWATQEITKGSYKIADGILYCYNVQYIYMMDRVGALIDEGYSPLEIQISDKTLSFTGVDIYTSNGKTDGISGHWETKKWATSYNNKPEYSGYINCAYDIDQSSSTYFRQIKYIDNPAIEPIEDRDLLEYHSPYLKMVSAGGGVVNYKVEFKNSKMYWYRVQQKYNLVKE